MNCIFKHSYKFAGEGMIDGKRHLLLFCTKCGNAQNHVFHNAVEKKDKVLSTKESESE